MQYLLFVLLAPIAAAIAVTLGVYTWRHRRVPTALALFWCMVVIAGWLVFNTLELLASTEASTLFWAKLTYLFIGTAPVAWFAFALRYAGWHQWLRPARFWAVGVIPVLTLVLALTNDLHHLVWESYSFHLEAGLLSMRVGVYGPWFWVVAAYNYALLLLGVALIARAYLVSHPLYRRQAAWAIVGAVAPVLFNLVYVFRLIPGFRKDYTALAFAFGGLAFAVAIFRHRLFDLAPMARQALVDRMEDGVLLLDGADRIVDLNPAAQGILGVVADQALGYPAGQLWAAWPDIADRLRGDQETPFEIVLETAGVQQYYDVRVSSLVSRRGRASGRLIVLRDITWRKEVEEQMRRSNLELQSRNAELDAFAHTVAHDVKGLLATVVSAADMLGLDYEHLPENERNELLGTVSRCAWKAVGVVDELLVLAKVRASEDVVLEPLDMVDIVAEAQERLTTLIAVSGAEIVGSPEEWPRALGRGPWVEEVWVNYISNAIQHGGRPPRVELGATAQDDGTVRFWVHDNGAGLTAEQQSRLFRPFTQLHQAQAGGFGLGLSIVLRIVEKMGGQVGVESTGVPGDGCTFSFVLPRMRIE